MKSKVTFFVLSSFILGIMITFVGFTSVPLYSVDRDGPVPPANWYDDVWTTQEIDCTDDHTAYVHATWPFLVPPPPKRVKANEVKCFRGGNAGCMSLTCRAVINT